MGETKELKIKNQTYYYFDDIINVRNFHSNILKIDKKSHKDNDIYYICYITVKKSGDCENIYSLNRLYLIFHSATGYFKEKNGKKYLILDLTEKYEEVFPRIVSGIKTIHGGKDLFYEKNYARLRVDTDDDLPLNKPVKFPMLTIIIRCVFQESEKLYRQIYLTKFHKIYSSLVSLSDSLSDFKSSSI